jgi:hypothetical protein
MYYVVELERPTRVPTRVGTCTFSKKRGARSFLLVTICCCVAYSLASSVDGLQSVLLSSVSL